MDGIHLRVPKAFSRERRIKKNQLGTAILVFGSMWSFTGRGNICYASIGLGPDDEENPKIGKSTLCSRSGLSKNTVVRYKKLLIQLGWIEVQREGRGLNDTITLHEIAQVGSEIQNPNDCDPTGENLATEGFQNPNTQERNSGGVLQTVGMPVQNCTDNIERVEEWEKFLNWSRGRLTRSSIETLENMRVNLDGNILNIKGTHPESIKIIIEKYLTEETSKTFVLRFESESDLSESPNIQVGENEISEDVKTELTNSETEKLKHSNNWMNDSEFDAVIRELERLRTGQQSRAA
ncbi:helix-turn-helix domain-containing protein [Leptospira alexanderi]|uniref:helix-turn-helix domain-containing protein n=1 Tax=Leptospira alexanderi TaxID=100053 RepID=UPI0009911D88